MADTRKSPLAFLSIILVIVLFGGFWLWQQKQMPTTLPSIPFTPPRQKKEEDLSTLQSSTINIPIPSFESAL